MEEMRVGVLKIGLLDLIMELPSHLIMVEIGCFKGESTELFLNSGKVLRLYAVDTWRSGRFRQAEVLFDKRFKDSKERGKIKKLRMTMSEAIPFLPKVNFVYIDGDHTYEWVKKDITNSLRILRKGGILAGHDYVNRGNVGVIQAVNEMVGVPDKIYKDSSWLKLIV